MRDHILRGDPFDTPADLSDPWQARLERLQARAHRPVVAITGADLRTLIGLLRATSRQAYLAEDHCDRLRHEVAVLEGELVGKHASIWEAA